MGGCTLQGTHVPKRIQENSLPHSLLVSLARVLLVTPEAQTARTSNVATAVAIAATATLCWLVCK